MRCQWGNARKVPSTQLLISIYIIMSLSVVSFWLDQDFSVGMSLKKNNCREFVPFSLLLWLATTLEKNIYWVLTKCPPKLLKKNSREPLLKVPRIKKERQEYQTKVDFRSFLKEMNQWGGVRKANFCIPMKVRIISNLSQTVVTSSCMFLFFFLFPNIS